jgi:NAD(P)-dependent dehydrogenase (short-subunit alcohol dehydrogenase family)
MHCMRAELRESGFMVQLGTMPRRTDSLLTVSDNGSIVTASSIAGVIGFAKNAAYTASKHAVIGLSRSAAKEVGDRGIRVNCISP